ncbi:MAG: sensor histidine kinase [Bryobacteraceae bacterium]
MPKADEESAALREQNEMLLQQLAEEHQMASIGRLLAGIVHEINTPIGSIFSNNEVLRRSVDKLRELLADPRPDNLAKAGRILDTAASLAAVDKIACERIASVIRGLKTFSRADPGDELRKADINENLRNTLKLAQAEYRRRVTIATDFGEVPEVECYPHLLNQVFLNLLVNAGHAIEGEGVVTVRTRAGDGAVHIWISDTGSGMTPEVKAKIFETGFTTKPVGVGTGLGLALSRRIVEKHGGTIEFESEPGVGTTFHVSIPLRQQ